MSWSRRGPGEYGWVLVFAALAARMAVEQGTIAHAGYGCAQQIADDKRIKSTGLPVH